MWRTKVLLLLQLVYLTNCMDQLQIAYEWTQPEHYFESSDQEMSLRASGLNYDAYVPTSVAVHANTGRIFVAFPRLRNGVLATLNTLLVEDVSKSPKFKPYPSWSQHTQLIPEVISPFKIHIDRCDRLWVLDSGKMNMLEPNSTQHPPTILIYDLTSNSLLQKFLIPDDQVKEDSWFINIAVEDTNCSSTYAYAADMGKAGIVVYNTEKNDSWRITHHYFHPDPLACDFNVKGYNFSWAYGLYGLALSAPNADNFSTLYFHPMSSFGEFKVSTEYLRNQSVADNNFDVFKHIGDRGPNAQSSASFIDPETGVLFYSLINLNAVACWRTSNKQYTMKNQGRIYMNDSTMIYPADIKVYSSTVWILSNKLPIYMYGSLDSSAVNFRLFSAPVVEAISHTACDIKQRLDILDKFVKGVGNITSPLNINMSPNSSVSLGSISFAVLLSWFLSLAVLY